MGITLDYLTGAAGPSGFGSKSTAEEVTADLNLAHITAIVTGATSGIGAETARVLAKRGARVIVPARNLRGAEALRAAIQEETPNARIIILKMDLSSLKSVRSFVTEFLSLNLPLNILINNAGVSSRKFKLSEDGFELDFATNHLGHFLLTSLLVERMKASALETGREGRIVNVASCLHSWIGKQGIKLDSINDSKSFVEPLNYAQSKLANILHVKELSRQLKETGANVTANALHPGIVKTNIIREHGVLTDAIFLLASKFLKSIPQGAATICYVATHPGVDGATGKYYADCNEAACSSCADDMGLAYGLWQFSENVTASWGSEVMGMGTISTFDTE